MISLMIKWYRNDIINDIDKSDMDYTICRHAPKKYASKSKNFSNPYCIDYMYIDCVDGISLL